MNYQEISPRSKMALLTLEICSVMIYLNKGDFSLYARNIVLTIMKRKYQLLRFCMILD